MRAYLIIALLGLALLLAGNTALQKYDAVKVQNGQLAKDLKSSKAATEAANAAALVLKEDLRFERALQIELHEKQSQLSSELFKSEILIKRLQHENKELSDWAANDLPGTAKRLRQRPAITGASDYQNWLSSRNRLHLERNEPSEQRQPAE